MRTSLSVTLAIAAAFALGACAARKPHKPPPKPLYAAHSATLDITYGINVIGIASMPRGFTPDLAHPLMWLRDGPEIAVAGNLQGRTLVIGFSGPRLSNSRVLAEDFGPGAPGGNILDVGVSPDGLMIATAVAEPSQSRLELVINDDVNLGHGHPVASIDGVFDAAQIAWLDNATIALVADAPQAAGGRTGASGGAIPERGLHIITIGPQNSSRYLDRITCPLSRLAFSPNRYFAVGQGGPDAPPAIVDVHDQTCRTLRIGGPIRVLGWNPGSTAFLYSAGYGSGGGVFRFDLASGKVAPVAISSGAAAYAGDGTLIAAGNSMLSRKSIALNPNARTKVEVAQFDPHQPELRLNSLGFETTPAMLAASQMVFSQVSGRGIIDMATPGVAGPLRELIEYAYPSKAVFVLAAGAAQGPVTMSWSPDGILFAFVDGTPRLWTLTLLAPPG
jgi:hypothetical protein